MIALVAATGLAVFDAGYTNYGEDNIGLALRKGAGLDEDITSRKRRNAVMKEELAIARKLGWMNSVIEEREEEASNIRVHQRPLSVSLVDLSYDRAFDPLISSPFATFGQVGDC